MEKANFADFYNCGKNSLERYKCKNCDFKANVVIFLMQHRLHFHRTLAEKNQTCQIKPILRSYTCRNCNFETNSLLHWIRHTKLMGPRHKAEAQGSNMQVNCDDCFWYYCGYCSYKTKYRSDLKKHAYIKHSFDEDKRWFGCFHCPFKTRFKCSLKCHFFSKHTDKKTIPWFKCDHCSYKTKDERALKKHINVKHTRDDDARWFSCSGCSFMTRFHSSLKRHLHSKRQQLKFQLRGYMEVGAKGKADAP